MTDQVVFDDYFNKVWIEWIGWEGVKIPFLHQDLRTEWYVSTYKMGLKRVLKALRKIRTMGHPIVYVRIPVDEKLKKFEEMLGFTEYHRDSDHIYLFQRTDI